MEKEENSAIVIDIRAPMASFNYSINLVIWGMYKYPCYVLYFWVAFCKDFNNWLVLKDIFYEELFLTTNLKTNQNMIYFSGYNGSWVLVIWLKE